MANKGQQFKKYDLDFKNKILQAYKSGESSSYLSQKYGVPKGTIKTWNEIFKKHGALDKAKKGRPTGTNLKDYKERFEILKKFQDFLVKQEQKKK